MHSDTILCLSSFEKGQDFLRESAAQGARTLFLTIEKLKDASWPRDILAELYLLPSFDNRADVLNAVSYLARTERIARIVALDEFDMELAAYLREHLRIAGSGITATSGVRDKLVMRELADNAGITVPAFIGVVNHGEVAEWMRATPSPWLLKPRTQASAIGIRKLTRAEELWPILEQLGDRQSHHLLERFIPGEVYHVDAIITHGNVVFAETHRYAKPPFDVMHGGGIFCSRTCERGGDQEAELRAQLQSIVDAIGIRSNVVHAEFIRAAADGRYYFLEIAARVGGAHIADMVEASTGINLWREWARLELAQARGVEYVAPPSRQDHGGVIISLARQEWPDTSAYDDPEIVWRMKKKQHAGLVVTASAAGRVRELLDSYMMRFHVDFHASLPAPEKATS